MRDSVTRRAEDEPHADRPSADVAKVRPCLRCKTPFPSKWAGERICTRCKGTTTWRSGEALSTVPARRHS